MVKFELAELRKVHGDLVESLANMRKANKSAVEPVLTGLKQLVRTISAVTVVSFCK